MEWFNIEYNLKSIKIYFRIMTYKIVRSQKFMSKYYYVN